MDKDSEKNFFCWQVSVTDTSATGKDVNVLYINNGKNMVIN